MTNFPKVAAIILARGGSKGIPKKNLHPILGRPLVTWSIEQAMASKRIKDVFVSSDNDEILNLSENEGARTLKRTALSSNDTASSESAWKEAIEQLKESGEIFDLIVGIQPTSPVRSNSDFDQAIDKYYSDKLDSLFSSSKQTDFFLWRKKNISLEGINHDHLKRKRRQDIGATYLENGSFYIFRPEDLINYNNRLSGIIGMYPMENHKNFQLDEIDDVPIIEKMLEIEIVSRSK